MKIDENNPSLLSFPKILLDNVVDGYEDSPGGGKYDYIELDETMFIYDGEYKRVNDWQKENSFEDSPHYVLRETIEEIVCENIGTHIVNKGFVTRSPEDFIIKKHSIVFNTRISYIFSEESDIWSWVPTFLDLFEVLKEDDFYYDHYEIMRDVCIEVLKGNFGVDVKTILNNHILNNDPNCYLVLKHDGRKRELHPIVFHLLLKQIMISEKICYPHSLGAKLPLKAFYYIKELNIFDFLDGLNNSFNWDSIAKKKKIKVWDPTKLR